MSTVIFFDFLSFRNDIYFEHHAQIFQNTNARATPSSVLSGQSDMDCIFADVDLLDTKVALKLCTDLPDDVNDDFKEEDIMALYKNMQWDGCYTPVDEDVRKGTLIESFDSETYGVSNLTDVVFDIATGTSMDDRSNLFDADCDQNDSRSNTEAVDLSDDVKTKTCGTKGDGDKESDLSSPTQSDLTSRVGFTRRVREKWQVSQVEALMIGVQKHGKGKWKNIKNDISLRQMFKTKSAVDLKDKWRNVMKRVKTGDKTLEQKLSSIMEVERRKRTRTRKRSSFRMQLRSDTSSEDQSIDDTESRISTISTHSLISEGQPMSAVIGNVECTSHAKGKLSLTCMTCLRVFKTRASKSRHVNNPNNNCGPFRLPATTPPPAPQPPLSAPTPTLPPSRTHSTTSRSYRRQGDPSDYYRLKGKITCMNCGSQKTPQWREGPDGPRKLCNACGVRFKKNGFL